MSMIVKSDNKEYVIDDSILQNRPEKVYVQEIPSLRINYGHDGSLAGVSGHLYNLCVPHFSKEFENHDSNFVSVCSFPPFPKRSETLDFIVAYIKHNIQNENTKLVFDNLYEGHVLGPITGIYKILKEIQIKPSNVYFFTTGMQVQKIYDDFCVQNNITDKINVRVINVWERHTSRRPESGFVEPTYEIKNKEKNFLCFNRIARKQRVGLLGLLYDKNLVDNSYYSFFPSLYNNGPLEQSLLDLKQYLDSDVFNTIENQMQMNKAKFPLLLNSDSVDNNVNYVKKDDEQYYSNSYFSIVTETFFFATKPEYIQVVDEVSVFFSEKIFKPIMCKHPFIMLNRPYALSYLKKIGYKTFAPYIDESYDNIEDDQERLLAIVKEIERLTKQTDEEWLIWQKNIANIIEHNYKVLVSKDIKDHVFFEN